MSGKVRIIGGIWRGRNIKVVDLEGLRPSADRVRETLFNWLGQRLEHLVCLDMFAGSGALGFEALSRGAKQVVMLELHPVAHRALVESQKQFTQQENTQEIGLLNIHKTDALMYCEKQRNESFDLIFIDPPFSDEGLVKKSLEQAMRLCCFSEHAAIYVEYPKNIHLDELLSSLGQSSHNWHIARTIRSGLATGSLLRPLKV